MKIEVGMYARTDDGIKEIIEYEYDDNYENGHRMWFKNSRSGTLYSEEELPECSWLMTDLIEVGDYVNGYKVTYVYPNLLKVDSADIWEIHISDIKSIVTKEQFAAIEHRVEGDKK